MNGNDQIDDNQANAAETAEQRRRRLINDGFLPEAMSPLGSASASVAGSSVSTVMTSASSTAQAIAARPTALTGDASATQSALGAQKTTLESMAVGGGGHSASGGQESSANGGHPPSNGAVMRDFSPVSAVTTDATSNKSSPPTTPSSRNIAPSIGSKHELVGWVVDERRSVKARPNESRQPSDSSLPSLDAASDSATTAANSTNGERSMFGRLVKRWETAVAAGARGVVRAGKKWGATTKRRLIGGRRQRRRAPNVAHHSSSTTANQRPPNAASSTQHTSSIVQIESLVGVQRVQVAVGGADLGGGEVESVEQGAALRSPDDHSPTTTTATSPDTATASATSTSMNSSNSKFLADLSVEDGDDGDAESVDGQHEQPPSDVAAVVAVETPADAPILVSSPSAHTASTTESDAEFFSETSETSGDAEHEPGAEGEQAPPSIAEEMGAAIGSPSSNTAHNGPVPAFAVEPYAATSNNVAEYEEEPDENQSEPSESGHSWESIARRLRNHIESDDADNDDDAPPAAIASLVSQRQRPPQVAPPMNLLGQTVICFGIDLVHRLMSPQLLPDEIAARFDWTEITPQAREADVADILRNYSYLPLESSRRYKIEGKLGEGTFGFVIAAYDHVASREVAVKFIAYCSLDRDNWVLDEVFGWVPNEAHAQRVVDSEYVAKCRAVFFTLRYLIMVTDRHGDSWHPRNPVLQGLPDLNQHHNQPFRPQTIPDDATNREVIALMSLHPTTLLHFVQAHSRVPDLVVRLIFRRICEGVNDLNSAGLRHNDLKPANITINRNYEIKLIDLGLTSRIPAGNRFRKFVRQGTFGFMPPEVMRGEYGRAGPAQDIWALGVILFFLLYKDTPLPPEQIVNPPQNGFMVLIRGLDYRHWSTRILSRIFVADYERRATIADILMELDRVDLLDMVTQEQDENRRSHLWTILTDIEGRLQERDAETLGAH